MWPYFGAGISWVLATIYIVSVKRKIRMKEKWGDGLGFLLERGGGLGVKSKPNFR